mgnify:CR=1
SSKKKVNVSIYFTGNKSVCKGDEEWRFGIKKRVVNCEGNLKKHARYRTLSARDSAKYGKHHPLMRKQWL